MRPIFQVLVGPSGQGKTEAALDVYAGLLSMRPPMNPGGVCLRPRFDAQTPTQFTKTHYQAYFLATQEWLPFAQLKPEASPAIAQERTQAWHEAWSPWRVDPDAYDQVLDHVLRDLEDPAIDALILDEIGDLLGRPPRKSGRSKIHTPQTRRVTDLVQAMLDNPKPFTLVVLGNVRTPIPGTCRDLIRSHPSRVTKRDPIIRVNDRNFDRVPLEILLNVRRAREAARK